MSQPVTPPSSELPPKTPEDPQDKLPETGESAFPLTLLGTGSLALAAWLIRKRPKTDC
ncbi:LPXTG cell wall anchor domain-containing protein [Abiotrophia defectiva]|nr:LPXTG cell wall anchor domain-containing protein [Abiotrophia defectiva]